MAITWVKNTFDILLPYEDGFALSSTIDPIREAQKWWDLNQKNANWCDRWIIIGGGGGFHLNYLESEKLFGVVEFRWDSSNKGRLANNLEIIYEWRSQMESLTNVRWGLFQFRPAWQNRTDEFTRAYNILNGQAPTSKFFNKLSAELFI